MSKKLKMPVAKLVTLIITIVAASMFVVGVFTPPMWQVHGSVLQGIGLMLGFAALWTAGEAFIEHGADGKLSVSAGGASATVEVEVDKEEKK